MNEEQKIIELKRKINNDDFRRQEKEIKEQNRQKKLAAAAAPKKKKRKLNIINFIFSVFVIYFAYTAFTQYQMLDDLSKNIDSKKVEKAELEKEVQELKEDVEQINNEELLLEIVEKIARNQYKMVKPNETIYIDKNKNDNKLIKGIGFEDDL